MSPSVRRTFDILKAEEMRKRAGGMSYAALAKAMGMDSRQSVGHWFRERGEPNVQQMKAMAEALGCHWLELTTENTVIVTQEKEAARLENMRKLDESDQAELDEFIAFKLAQKEGKDG